jgi:nitronate monooxygenase
MNWNNIFTQRLNLAYPIVQALMLGVSTPEMAAAVSNEGGLGSLAVGGLSPDVTRQLIRRTKSLTKNPFAVNLFVHEVPEYDDEDLEPMRRLLLQFAKKRGLALDLADLNGFTFYTYHDQIDILIEEGISIVSFTFGCPDVTVIQLLQEKGCVLIGTATCVEEALFLEQRNVDMVAVQGIEAGGHRGSFIETIPLPQVGLFSLLTQVKSVVQMPCIAAGGINSASTIKAAFDLGADAVQIGTAFIGTVESEAIPSYKSKLKFTKDVESSLTRAFSGRWARGIANDMMKEIEESGIPIPPYPIQNSLTSKLRKLAQQADDCEYTNLWAGQSVRQVDATQTREVFRCLVREYEELGVRS